MIDTQVTNLTPDMAKDLLKANTHNRPLRRGLVEFYAAEMAKGIWQENGDSIRLDKNGVILDGQHRLHAVIKSGVAIKTLIVKGLEPEVFDTIDTGVKRRPADVASMYGIKNANNVMSAAKWLYIYNLGNFNGTLSVAASKSPSNHDLMELVLDTPELVDLASKCVNKITRRAVSMMYGQLGSYVFLMYLFIRDDEDTAWLFHESFTKGVGLTEHDPVYILREKLLSWIDTKRSVTMRERMALMFKAYKYFRDNEKCSPQKLRFREYGATRERFPKLP